MAKMEMGVVGLGKFGYCLAETLVEMKQSVVGVDLSENRVKIARELLSQVYRADATDKTALRQLGFHELPVVVVSIGSSMEASILITMNLKEIGVDKVWVKAISEDHEKILYRLGADLVIFPERYVAKQLAHRLAVPGLLNYLPVGGGVVLQEFVVDAWAGQTLRQLNLPTKHKIQVVGIRRPGEVEFSFVPQADTELHKGDVVVVIGNEQHLGEL